MKQILYFLSTVFFICSCSLTYDGEERILFEGKIIDENGQPMPGIYVLTEAKKGGDRDEVSYDYTDNLGNFKMLFSSPTNENEIRVLVNYEDENSVYSKSVFYNIQDEDYDDFKIDFGTISLYPTEESVLLTISVEENSEYHIRGWNLEGKVAENYFNFSPFDPDVYFDYSSQSLVSKNQIITLYYYYTYQHATEVMEDSVEIEIENQPVSYEITF